MGSEDTQYIERVTVYVYRRVLVWGQEWELGVGSGFGD